jgi:hypothetical protein
MSNLNKLTDGQEMVDILHVLLHKATWLQAHTLMENNTANGKVIVRI